MLSTLLISLAAWSSPISAQSLQEERLILENEHFGRLSDPVGGTRLVALDGRGARTQGAQQLELRNARALFGPGEVAALEGAADRRTEREVRLFNTQLEPLGTYILRADQEVRVGAAGVLFRRRSDHGAGAAFELGFADLGGNRFATQARAGLVLLETLALADGRWLSTSLEPGGRHRVHCFSARGEELWERDAGSLAVPGLAELPLGETLLGVFLPGFETMRLEHVSLDGTLLSSQEVPAFRSALVIQGGRRVLGGRRALLQGAQSLSLVELGQARPVWTRRFDERFCLGAAMALSSDGLELAAVSYSMGAGDQPLELKFSVFDVASGAPVAASRELGSAPSLSLRLRALRQLEDGAWQALGRDRVINIER